MVTDVVGAAGMSHPHGLVGRERSRYRPYVLHVFLCVTIQPKNKDWKAVRTKTETYETHQYKPFVYGGNIIIVLILVVVMKYTSINQFRFCNEFLKNYKSVLVCL